MKRRPRGMSLLEVMIAFVIILLVALHLMSMFASGQRHSVRAQQYSTAAFLAHNKMQELLTAPPIELVEGDGKFLAPFQDYLYNVDTSPFEGYMVVLEVEVISPRGAVARTRTVVTEPVRFFGVSVDPATFQVAFSPGGGSSIAYRNEIDGTLSMSPPTPDGRSVEGLAGRPGSNLLWTGALRSGLLPFVERTPSIAWKAGLAPPITPIPPRFTGLASDASASRLFVGDASNRCLWMIADSGSPAYLGGPIAPDTVALGSPAGVATDQFGSLVWVADRENQCLRKLHVTDVNPGGSVEAEPGVGWWSNTQFRPPAVVGLGSPQGVAIDRYAWAVYVTDGGRLYRYLTGPATWSVLAVLPAAVADAGPSGLALDELNNLLYLNCRSGKLWRFKLADLTFTQLWSQ